MVLNHEQGHFDLTEIHRRRFDQRARRWIGSGGSCRGDTERARATFLEAEIQGKLLERRPEPLTEECLAFHTISGVPHDVGHVDARYPS